MEPQSENHEKINFKNNLDVTLNVPYEFNGNKIDEATLLPSNGIAEEIFLKKLQDKPYTWIGNVLSAGIGYLGALEVGIPVRQEYQKTKTVAVPQIIKRLPLAEANSLLVEVHRRVWKTVVPKQSILCKFCGDHLKADVDLSNIKMSPENQEVLEKMSSTNQIFDFVVVDLVDSFTMTDLISKLNKPDLSGMENTKFDRLTFRVPTLNDAIKNEKHVSDSLLFWRRMAQDCLVKIESVKDNVVFPDDYFPALGLELFKQYLSAEDLSKVRGAMREEVPTLPFTYEETCPCDQRRTIPFTMEASGFFSE
jgi:hypothetical protein